MAKDQERRLKGFRSVLDGLIDRQRQRQPPPKPSYFAQQDIDREAERREAELRKAAQRREAERRAELNKPPPAPPRHPIIENAKPKATVPGQQFDAAAQTSKLKEKQIFTQRFRSDAAIEAAVAAMEEAARQRDFINRVKDAAIEKQMRIIVQWTGSRPMSNEGGKAVNEDMQRAQDEHAREKEAIDRELDMALQAAEFLNTPGQGFRPKPRLLITGPEPDSSEPFNHAAAKPRDWAAIFFTAVQQNITVDAAIAKVEPPQEPAMGQSGTPVSDYLKEFNQVGSGISYKPDLGPDR